MGPRRSLAFRPLWGHRPSSARLLVPSGRGQDRLSCAPPFGGSLTVVERHGDPGTNTIFFPAAGQAAPQVPEGLKQRFMPFGGQRKRPALGDAAGGPPRKKPQKKGKRRLHLTEYMWGPQEEVSAVEANGKESPQELNSSALAPSQETSLSADYPNHRRKKKKKKVKEEATETFLTEADSITHHSQSETHSDSLTQQPALELSLETSLGGNGDVEEEKKKKKKKKKEKEAAVEEEPMDIKEEPGLESSWEGLVKASGHKKKKKKKEKVEEEVLPKQGNGSILETGSIKEEPIELATGSANEEPLEPNVPIHKKKKKKKAKEEEEEGTKQSERTVLKEETQSLEEPEHNVETPSQKHKKKKKKEHKMEEA
nr:PREDICTED: DNA-directed RNA polymerase I subunit RPA34 [Anolis carolinensis]|eukprot:XP_008121513.1 PREDICTED: DNA-directed RNA polymerase I subunit RPA34 [Anolis carolinensis]